MVETGLLKIGSRGNSTASSRIKLARMGIISLWETFRVSLIPIVPRRENFFHGMAKIISKQVSIDRYMLWENFGWGCYWYWNKSYCRMCKYCLCIFSECVGTLSGSRGSCTSLLCICYICKQLWPKFVPALASSLLAHLIFSAKCDEALI